MAETPNGVIAVRPDTGKTIYSSGVVVTENVHMLRTRGPYPNVSTVNIASHRFLGYHDTAGPIIQARIETWQGEEPGKVTGEFDLRPQGAEPLTSELFTILAGAVTFEFMRAGAPSQHVTLGAGGSIYFPSGLRYSGKCVGPISAQVHVVSVREVAHAIDAEKGNNIPTY